MALIDQITAEQLKYARHSTSVTLDTCFSGLLMHGIVLLVPVVKDEIGQMSII